MKASCCYFLGQDVKSFCKPLQEKGGRYAYNLWSVSGIVATKGSLYCVSQICQGKQSKQVEKILLSEQRFKGLGSGGYDLFCHYFNMGKGKLIYI